MSHSTTSGRTHEPGRARQARVRYRNSCSPSTSASRRVSAASMLSSMMSTRRPARRRRRGWFRGRRHPRWPAAGARRTRHPCPAPRCTRRHPLRAVRPALDQRQSQTQPALASIQGGVCLHEGLERRPSNSDGMPAPVSDTRTRTCGFAGSTDVDTVARPPLPVNFAAFCSRFPITCARRVPSAFTVTRSGPSRLELGFAFLEERAVVLDGPVVPDH